MRKATSPNPKQIAMFGHIARALQAKGWKPTDLNQAMGFDRSYSSAYQWINGKSAPGNKHRAKLSQVTGIPERDLTSRKLKGSAVVALPLPSLPVTTTAVAMTKPSEVLGFSVANDGNARIKLDVTLPMNLATPLLRMLLDAGLVIGSQTNDKSQN